MKYILLLYLLTLAVSCKSKKEITGLIPNEGLRAEILLPTPSPNLSIGYWPTRLTEIRPFVKTVRDEVTKTTLKLEVDETGFIEANCFADPDTIRIEFPVFYPAEQDCLPPDEKKNSPSKLFWAVFLFIMGYYLRNILMPINPRKLYDRFKNFISTKFRRK